MNLHWVMDPDGTPRPATSEAEYAAWCDQVGFAGTQVAVDLIEGRGDDDAEVSTVFLAMDASFGRGTPLLFETMVLGGPWHGYQKRYHTREAAAAGHARIVAAVRAGRDSGTFSADEGERS